MIVAIAVSALTIISWTQPWFTIALVDDELGGPDLTVAGDVAAGGLAGLGLAGLALVGALSIAGRVIRVILGVLQILIGATVTLSATVAVADPVDASSASVTDATGIAGSESVVELVRSVTSGFWPYAAVVLGVSGVVLGVLIVVTAGRWPGATRKYQAVRIVVNTDVDGDGDADLDADVHDDVDVAGQRAVAMPAMGDGGTREDTARRGDAVADWDALSDGSDPTSR